MIDLKAETLLSFPQAARRFASYRQGKPAHVSRLHRYRLHGYRGVRLEAARQGGQWVTSVEAIERFTAALTEKFAPAARQEHGENPTTRATIQSREKRLERAAQELTALGV